MKVEQIVHEIVYNVVKRHGITEEMITPEKRIMEDLNADSLDVIEMMLAFQERIGIFINEEDIAEIRTIQDIYALAKIELEEK